MPQGLTYLADSWQHDPVTLSAIAAALAMAILQPKSLRQLTVAPGLLLYVSYVIRLGGDFMSGRFLAVPYFVAVAIIVWNARPSWRSPATIIAVLLVGLGGVTSLPATVAAPPPGDDPERFIRVTGIADERYTYTPYTRLVPALKSGAAPVPGSEQTGRRLRARGTRQLAWIAIGMIGYGAGPDLFIVDRVGLADPLLARLPAIRPWKIGHFERALPAGYLDTAASGRMSIVDPEVAEYYRQLALITRGRLWSGERWRAIIRMNLGRISPPRRYIRE